MKSPLRYPGGKSKVVKFLASKFPKNIYQYREPFLGGGSLFLHTLENNLAKKYWINDLDSGLHNFWNHLINYPNSLYQDIIGFKSICLDSGLTPKEYFEFCKVTMDIVPGDYYTVNRCSFSGLGRMGGFSPSAYEKRFTQSQLDYLLKLGHFLQTQQNKIRITNKSFEDLISPKVDYLNRLNGAYNDIFVFADPPYFGNKDSNLYFNHKDFNHEALFLSLSLSPYKWMLTYDNVPEIRETYKRFNIEEFNFGYSMSKDKIGKELLITNYEPN